MASEAVGPGSIPGGTTSGKDAGKRFKTRSFEILKKMVEARGVEPLSEMPSAMVSTCLAGGLEFRRGLARLRRCLS